MVDGNNENYLLISLTNNEIICQIIAHCALSLEVKLNCNVFHAVFTPGQSARAGLSLYDDVTASCMLFTFYDGVNMLPNVY